MHQFTALRVSWDIINFRGTSAAEARGRVAFWENKEQNYWHICAAITAIVSEDLEFFTPPPEQTAERPLEYDVDRPLCPTFIVNHNE